MFYKEKISLIIWFSINRSLVESVEGILRMGVFIGMEISYKIFKGKFFLSIF